MAATERDPQRPASYDRTLADMSSAFAAAADLPSGSVVGERANRAARILAHRLGTDVARLATLTAACRELADRRGAAGADWRRAEQLSWSALALAEALTGATAPVGVVPPLPPSLLFGRATA